MSDVVEKPALSEAPSHLGIVGRYLMTPDLFNCLKRVARTVRGLCGEILRYLEEKISNPKKK
jgi:UTP--glucose-1-phosphate uridylyltransferase